MDNRRYFYLKCDCDAHTVRFGRWEEDGSVGIDYMVNAFYSEQESSIRKFWNRLKLSISILFKGEYPLYEIYISKKSDVNDLADFLKSPVENKLNLDIKTIGSETSDY